WSAMRALLDRLGVRQSWAEPLPMAVLLWSSYLVGMELPGRRALFGSLAVELAGEAEPCAPFDYEARVASLTPRGEHRIAATIAMGGRRIAELAITALVREDSPAASAAEIEARVGRSEALRGKVALVTGASRGLGAALAQALAFQGA